MNTSNCGTSPWAGVSKAPLTATDPVCPRPLIDRLLLKRALLSVPFSDDLIESSGLDACTGSAGAASEGCDS